MKIWEIAAKAAEWDGSEANMDVGYFICPQCGEVVFENDWTSSEMMEDDCVVCPICRGVMADHYGIEEIMMAEGQVR